MTEFARQRFTIKWMDRPQFRILVSAPTDIMSVIVSRIAWNVYGRTYGRADVGYAPGTETLREFVVAAATADGSISGVRQLIQWAKETYGGTKDHHIDPAAVAHFEGWRAAESEAIRRLRMHGMDANSKHAAKLHAERHAMALLTHKARPGHGGNGTHIHLEAALRAALRNGGATI